MSAEINTSEMISDSHSEFSTHNSSFAKGARFTEAQLEAAITEFLGVEGYPHVFAEAIGRQAQEGWIKWNPTSLNIPTN